VTLGAILTLGAPGIALAQSDQVRLAITPVGQPGTFFDLTMAPGESRSLAVDVANDGSSAVPVRTYAAGVYTIVNGGFGARLRDEPETGMTTWLAYPTKVWTLAAGETVPRTFEINVPARIGPGEYITSLILENNQPIESKGTVDLNQFIRQALGVVVTVPGRRSPTLAIGGASTKVVAGLSVVLVAIANTGNVRLQPTVHFALFDQAGSQISETNSQMGTVYARTDTFFEVPLAVLLPAGQYVVRLTLADPKQDLSVASGALPFGVVAQTPITQSGGGSAGLTAATPGGGQDGSLAPGIVWFAVVLLALAALGMGAVVR
jgi:hypothetical protein